MSDSLITRDLSKIYECDYNQNENCVDMLSASQYFDTEKLGSLISTLNYANPLSLFFNNARSLI